MNKLSNQCQTMHAGKGAIWAFFATFIAFFVFYSDAALADEASDQAMGVLDSFLSMPINYQGVNAELAHKYFNDIFGSFIFLPWGQGNAQEITLLARAVGFTNILALFMGVVFLYYVMIGGALQTAHQGEVLGKSWSSVWIPMRVTIGFGLIMPAGGIGGGVISVAQIFIIWLIMMGSNAATVLWDKTVDNIGMGTPITAPAYSTGITPTKNMLKMLACTDSFIRGRTLNKKKVAKDDLVVLEVVGLDGKRNVLYTLDFDESVGSYRSRDGLGSFILQNKAIDINFASHGACGSIQLSTVTRHNSGVFDSNEEKRFLAKEKQAAIDSARAVIASTIDQLTPIAMSFKSDKINPVGITQALSDGDEENPMYQAFYNSVPIFSSASSSYSRDIVEQMHNSITGKTSASEWIKKIKSGGWIKAGAWFHEIGNYSGESLKSISEINNGIKPSTAVVCIGNGLEMSDCMLKSADMASSTKLADKIAASYVTSLASSDGSNNEVGFEDKISSSCSDSESCSVSTDTFFSAHRSVARSIINVLSETSNTNNPSSDISGLSNPFQAVTSIGHFLNNSAVAVWGAGAVLATFSSAQKAVKDSWLGKAASALTLETASAASGGLSGLVEYIIPSLFALMLLLASTGFVLAYLLPFLPVVTWINMVTGYLLTVVEATIAAPLAIIMMVTPEGEGISGTRLERAMQLMAMAILKPSLMIIGIIASITLSYVSFGMLNNFFFEAASTSLRGDILDFAAMIIVYTTTALNLCKLNISIMHKLSDQILEWFSSGTGRQFGEHEAAGGMEHSISNMKGGANAVTQSMGATMADKRRMNLQERHRAEKSGAAPR